MQLFKFLQHFADDVAIVHTQQRRTLRLFGNVVNTLFRIRKRRFIVRAFHRRFNNLSGRTDEFSVHAVSRDDLLVRLIIRRGRSNLRELGDIRNTACLFNTTFLFQLVRHGDKVNGFSIVIHPFHCTQDIFVALLIKIVFRQAIHNIRRNLVVDQQTAKQRHFRIAVVGHRVHFVCHNFSSFGQSFLRSTRTCPVVFLFSVAYKSDLNSSSVALNSSIAAKNGSFVVRSTPAFFKIETGSSQPPDDKNSK